MCIYFVLQVLVQTRGLQGENVSKIRYYMKVLDVDVRCRFQMQVLNMYSRCGFQMQMLNVDIRYGFQIQVKIWILDVDFRCRC